MSTVGCNLPLFIDNPFFSRLGWRDNLKVSTCFNPICLIVKPTDSCKFSDHFVAYFEFHLSPFSSIFLGWYPPIFWQFLHQCPTQDSIFPGLSPEIITKFTRFCRISLDIPQFPWIFSRFRRISLKIPRDCLRFSPQTALQTAGGFHSSSRLAAAVGAGHRWKAASFSAA